VTATSALLVVAGLLLGRVAVSVILFVQSAALFAGSFIALPPRWFDRAAHDPSVFANWLRITLLWLLIVGGVVYLLRRAAALAGDAYSAARRDLILANRKLARSRRSREARLLAERTMRGHQKVQAVGQLSAGIAHLLNNALMVVRGVLDDLPDDRTARARDRASTAMNAAAQRVAEALRALMVFSRRDEADPQLVDLVHELRTIIEGLGVTFGSDVVIRVQGAAGLMIEIEPSALRLLVINLVLNARDAMPRGGEIRISVFGGRTIQLLVEDSGDGMTAETMALANDAFFTSRDPSRHAGLGLTIAVGIAEQAGGSLHLESTVGVGTRVVVRFPDARDLDRTITTGDSVPTLLHGTFLDANPDSGSTDVRDQAEPLDPADRDAWKSEITMRLARVAALVLGGVGIVTIMFGVAVPWFIYVALFASGPTIAIAGWRKELSQRTRSTLLTIPLIVLCAPIVGRSSYLASPALVGLIVAVAWIALLGSRWAGGVALTVVAATLLGFGARFVGSWSSAGVVLFLPDLATNWRRVAVDLGAADALLAFSVLAIIGSARRGIASMDAAKRQVRTARTEEERESARQLAAEREASRSARVAATGRVIGTLAHDVNNALQGVVATASELGESSLKDEEVELLMDDLWQAYEHCAALSTQFAATPETLPIRPASLDVSAEVQRMVRMLSSTLGTAIKLESAIASGGYVRIVETDLRRVVSNLVTNARDAIEVSGTIRVSVQRTGDHVVLEVGDTGIGMDPATRSRVFEAFFTTKSAGKGTGLGLHSVSRIVEQTEGTIEVDSAPGAGTTFRIRWPMAEPPVAKQRLRRDRGEASGGGGTVIVAEDDPMVRASIVRILEHGGYLVRAAADGDAALSLVTAPEACLALCIDGVMPGAASTTVIEEFVRRHPGAPVIVCSGQLPTDLARRGLASDLVTLLPKPFDPQQLRELLAARIAPVARPEPDLVGSDRTVLLVEDFDALRVMMERQLGKQGFRVLAFATPGALLERASTITPAPDLVVTDVNLPAMRGPELARMLTERWPALRVLFVTGAADSVTSASNQVLAKPFSIAQLRDSVSRVLRQEPPHSPDQKAPDNMNRATSEDADQTIVGRES
jgi:signal transduction histidine kinase/CheY-like chemotaxis protein